MTENPATEPVSPAEVPLAVTLAPAPTDKTLRQRTSLPVQGFRFAAVSLRMLKMIRKSHH
jgi:hypothetical protein